jgi:hypothetical protein
MVFNDVPFGGLGSSTTAYVTRRTAEGLSTREITRCLKRYIAREVHRAITRSLPLAPRGAVHRDLRTQTVFLPPRNVAAQFGFTAQRLSRIAQPVRRCAQVRPRQQQERSSADVRGARVQLTAYLWAYHVRPEQVEAFRHAYGPDGEWAAFFRRSDAYIRTDLLLDRTEPNRFVTIDYFAEPQARAHLFEAYGDAYLALDRRWAAATLTETVIGEFSLDAEV